jgi:hypothetical protein
MANSDVLLYISAGILEQSMGARNQVGIGVVPARQSPNF